MPRRPAAGSDGGASRRRYPPPRAKIGQPAARAAGPTGQADGPAMVDELVAEDDPPVARDDRDEVAFGADRVGAARQIEAPADPPDMGVDDDPLGPIEAHPEDDVGRFPPHARQCHQFGQREGDLAAMPLDEGPAAAEQVLCLRPEESGTADHPLDLLLTGSGKRGRGRPAAEQFRGHQVHPPVGALGRENRRQEELQWRAEVERATGGGIELSQPPGHGLPAGRAGLPAAGAGCRRRRAMAPLRPGVWSATIHVVVAR